MYFPRIFPKPKFVPTVSKQLIMDKMTLEKKIDLNKLEKNLKEPI